VPRECRDSHWDCQKGVIELRDIRGTLSPRTDKLPTIMKIRTPIAARRASWRDRFLEIARQVEGLEVRTGAALAAGLRPRARMAGFATLRRAHAR
jgi:hypothetical protein